MDEPQQKTAFVLFQRVSDIGAFEIIPKGARKESFY